MYSPNINGPAIRVAATERREQIRQRNRAGHDILATDVAAQGLLALGRASALPVVELQKDVYEVALKEVGTPWLIEIYSGMCASCKAYADIWHGVEAKVLQNTKVAVGRINMDEGGGPPLAMKYKGLLKDGIPAVIWIADPAKPYDHTVIDSGKARSSDELWATLLRKGSRSLLETAEL